MKTLMKDYKWQTILSCLAVLSPILPGLLRYGAGLPLWGIVALPVFCLVMQLFCLAVTFRDPGNQDQNRKAMSLIFWILPVVSIGANAALYRASQGKPVGISLVVAIESFAFIAIGNYLPKLRRNSTMGIKLPWTLRSDENWSRTHRFGGKVWVACGFGMFLSLLFPEKYFLIPLLGFIALAILLPTVYSYRLSKTLGDSEETPAEFKRNSKLAVIISLIALALCAVLLFTGNVNVEFQNHSLTASATYYPPITIDLGSVTDLSYLEHAPTGSRTFGFGSPRLALGQYRNEVFGNYISYRYQNVEAAVVIHCGETTYVLNAKDTPATQALYEAIKTAAQK